MKIIVLKNKISSSQKKRLSNVKSWFSYVFDLEFTEEKSNFNNIPLSDYSFIDGSGKTVTYKGIDETWYDENISKPAKARGFDIVILIVKESQWGNKETEGFGTVVSDCGIQEIAVKYYTSGKYGMGWGGKNVFFDGDKLEWIIIHELLHRLYAIKGIEDNTHKYFMEETPDKCLQDFKKQNQTVILTRLNDNGIQTTGVFDAYNNGKNMICYSLELPWKDNKRNISCIPKGTYTCKLTNSIKYGKVYKVLDVPGRTGILIHAGNYNKDTQGCILLGNDLKDINNDGQKDVTNSKLTLSKFMLFMGGKDFTLIIK